jgi:transposase
MAKRLYFFIHFLTTIFMSPTYYRPHAAGIDIGSDKFYVCVSDGEYRVFETYQEDCEKVAAYLLEHGIQSVAFESTGVYWIPLQEVLLNHGLEVYVVNPRQTKRRIGDTKSDVGDCQWIMKLHRDGYLRPSFFPEESILALRMLVRTREEHVRSRAQQENLIIKALTLMNLRLKEVINSVTSVSGLAVLKAIVAGERNGEVLLSFCHQSIQRNKSEAMLKALNGNFKSHYLFMLRQALESWEYFGSMMNQCDTEIAKMMDEYNKEHGTEDIEVKSSCKDSRTNNMPKIAGLHEKVIKMCNGADLTAIPCISDYTLMKFIAEVGTDLSSFPTYKQFAAWLGLAPKKNQSGKMKKNAYSPCSNGGQILRQAASSILNSKNLALGEFGRMIAYRRGKPVAIKAVARKISQYIYNYLVHGEIYVEKGAEEYKKRKLEKERKLLDKLARKLGMTLTPNQEILITA